MTSIPVERVPGLVRSRSLPVLAGVLLLVTVGVLAAVLLTREGPAVASEHQAPSFQLTFYQGGDGSTPVDLSEYYGQPIVVNFWAEWCTPCVVEMPHLQAVYQRFRDQGLVVIGADVGPYEKDHDRQAIDFLSGLGVTFPSGRINLREIDSAYHLDSVPTTVFIGRDGAIHAIWSGLIEEATLVELVAQIME
jgi:thiol-disulfide isomerase/thioredoxin